ncbi:hypothetical protein EMWEY_00059590, partial [Eimeria maxima]
MAWYQYPAAAPSIFRAGSFG